MIQGEFNGSIKYLDKRTESLLFNENGSLLEILY